MPWRTFRSYLICRWLDGHLRIEGNLWATTTHCAYTLRNFELGLDYGSPTLLNEEKVRLENMGNRRPADHTRKPVRHRLDDQEIYLDLRYSMCTHYTLSDEFNLVPDIRNILPGHTELDYTSLCGYRLHPCQVPDAPIYSEQHFQLNYGLWCFLYANACAGPGFCGLSEVVSNAALISPCKVGLCLENGIQPSI